MVIQFNGVIQAEELNDLLATVGWEVALKRELEESLDSSWGWMTLRDDEGHLAGFVQILSDDDKYAFILRFLVQRDLQSKGYGTLLFKRLLEILDAEEMVLMSWNSPEDEAFYSHFGLAQNNKKVPMFLGN